MWVLMNIRLNSTVKLIPQPLVSDQPQRDSEILELVNQTSVIGLLMEMDITEPTLLDPWERLFRMISVILRTELNLTLSVLVVKT
jgi:hypothetical protein